MILQISQLSTIETIQGFITLIFVVVSFILGILFVHKYFSVKKRELLLVGTAWLLLVSPYWPDSLAFLMILIWGVQMNDFMYFSYAMIFFPLIHIFWLSAMNKLVFRRDMKIIVILSIIQAVIFEIIYFYLLFTDYSLLGTRVSLTVVIWADFIVIYILISTVIFLTTGIMFVRESLRSDHKEIKLKGRILLISFVIFSFGITFEILAEFIEGIVLIARILIIFAAFFFYFGFTLPKFLRTLILKEK